MFDVIGVGANSVDYVFRVPAYPQAGTRDAKMPITGRSISCGGQMATALCTCASLGLRTQYIGVMGNDENGRLIRDELARAGIDLSGVIVRDAPNPSAVIIVDDVHGDRIVLWERTDRHNLDTFEVPRGAVMDARLLHVDDVDQAAAIHAARLARDAGRPVTSDIDRLTDDTEALVDAVTIPIFAAHVPGELTGETDLERALRKLRRRHSGLLCVTLGPEGAMLLDGDRLYREPAIQLDAIDTTGAGDVFRGAFIYALLGGLAPAEILRFANAAAGLSCTRLGAINGVPALEDVTRTLQPRPSRAGAG
jgi:sugar/nucleoside kinase (ribokinase family)